VSRIANVSLGLPHTEWARQKSRWIKGALCAYVIRLRVSYNQNDETLSQNSLMYLSKVNLPIVVNS